MMTAYNTTQFRMITINDILSEFRRGLITATQLLRNYILITCAPGWTIKINRKKICQELGISQKSFYRTIALMVREKEISWDNEPSDCQLTRLKDARDNHDNARDNHDNARDNHDNARDNHDNARDNHDNLNRQIPNKHKGSSDFPDLDQIDSNINLDLDQISPPTPSNEGGEKNPLSPNEKDKSFPDRNAIEEEILDPPPQEVSPKDESTKSTQVVEAEVIPKEKVSPARNTPVTYNNSKGFGKPEEPFGKKKNTLALQKQKAADKAIAGGCFESVEQEDAFFVQVQGFLKATNPSWNPTKIIGTAINQTNRLRTGQPRAEDRQNFALFLSGKMQQVQGLSYDHKTAQRDEAEKKRKEKEAFYAQYQDPTATSKSKLLQKEMGQC